MKTPPFALSASIYETSARRKSQKQNNTISILILRGALNMKYLLKSDSQNPNVFFVCLFV